MPEFRCPHCGGPIRLPDAAPAESSWPLGARLLAWILVVILGTPLFLMALYYSLYLLAPLFPR